MNEHKNLLFVFRFQLQSLLPLSDVILSERGPERTRGPAERQLCGVGSGVVSEESAFRAETSAQRPSLRHRVFIIFLLARPRRQRRRQRITPDIVPEPVFVLLHHRALLFRLVDRMSES